MNKKMNWLEALDYADSLGEGWRLPNCKELLILWDYDTMAPIIEMEPFYYWSSTTLAYYPYLAWDVSFYNGYVYNNNKYDNFYVRCVRGGQFDYQGSLIVMGLAEGQARITLNEDGTITDNCTGLTWEAA